MEVGRVGVDCVVFWTCHCCSVVVGPSNKYGGWKGGGWMCGVLGLPLLLCGGRSIRRQCLPEIPFIALLCKYDEIPNHIGGS